MLMSRGGHPPIPISLGEGEKEKLRSGAHSCTLGHGMVQRAQIVPACAEGESQVMIAKRLGVSPVTVGKWRRRYHAQGVAELHGEQPPGGPRTHDDERVAEWIRFGPAPCRGRHWRQVQDGTMAAELLHGEERVFHGDAGCQGLEKREERAGGDVECG
ncbi:MAG: helix-turn-helix domain-containing protein, partial [Synechococcus sp. SB0662_bin_45]|nr:helix-turn-helix domain-containing protein [Synechococcus sp. SB0662_bin_45]